MGDTYFIGVDVGTGSVRAALVDATGKVHNVHVQNTQAWTPLPDHYEQSSDNIWSKVCDCVKVLNFQNACRNTFFLNCCSPLAGGY